MRLRAVAAAAALLAPAVPAVAAPPAHRHGSVYATVTAGEVVLGNAVAERRWTRAAFRTSSLVDKRGRGERGWSAGSRDFTLTVGATDVGSEAFTVTSVDVARIAGGLRVTMALGGVPGLSATRVVEAYNGVAGFRTRTTLLPLVPLTLRGATLDEVAVAGAAPAIHALRAGADWREPGWTGPPLTVGDPHAGTWRDTRTAAPGAPLAGPAQWLSLAAPDGRTAFLVAERNDLPSSRASYDGSRGALVVDWSRDVLSLGPLEENGHAENPTGAPARHRVLAAGEPFALDAAFTGLGLDRAVDEPWQFARYLRDHASAPYDHDVVFNSNGTDTDRISTGAKDDMDYATVLATAPVAKALGVETFVLDDGWQAISGDWFPDSPEHPEPRWDGTPGSKFAPRFPDTELRAVREAIAPMRLGLWMSPMHFHPESATFRAHPEWACAPVGTGTAAVNVLDPESGSNEAGIGTWGPRAIPHVESRIREAITAWGVEYFKFDFLVWLDCAGQGSLHDYQEAFAAMVDRLAADFPHVTFQVDETNDYRLFPYASVNRGPSWFQNGTPTPDRLLHNLWNLAPFVPTESLGQHFLGGRQYERYPVATLMAAALLSHPTFFSELRTLPSTVVAEAAGWAAFRARWRAELTEGVTYPLLADPLAGGWTALQTWDPERARGAVVAFRQKDAAATTTLPLVGVPAGRTFDVYAAPDGAHVGTFTSAQLTAGLPVTLGRDGAVAWVVRPA